MLLITTSHGIVPTLKRELNYHRTKSFHGFDTGLYTNGGLEEAAHLNLWLRTASKVWLEIGEESRCKTFDNLFLTVTNCDWKQFFDNGRPIKVSVHTHQSTLNSGPTIQSVTHKAIIDQLTGEKDGNWFVNNDLSPVEVRVMIVNDKLRLYINTSGKALHQRGYRTESGEAPLREHIAAAMVLMTSRGYSAPLIDPMCGSGTIPIEAAMIASNHAPGLTRTFARESFPCIDTSLKQKLVHEAKAKIYKKNYQIIGYDNDPYVLGHARENSKRAGVGDIVSFEEKDLFDQVFDDNQTLITNPPYGQRLRTNELQKVHTTLAREGFTVNAATVISGYPEAEQLFRNAAWKHVKAKNGGNEVMIYVKRDVEKR